MTRKPFAVNNGRNHGNSLAAQRAADLALANGTSEGALKGWETRRAGGNVHGIGTGERVNAKPSGFLPVAGGKENDLWKRRSGEVALDHWKRLEKAGKPFYLDRNLQPVPRGKMTVAAPETVAHYEAAAKKNPNAKWEDSVKAIQRERIMAAFSANDGADEHWKSRHSNRAGELDAICNSADCACEIEPAAATKPADALANGEFVLFKKGQNSLGDIKDDAKKEPEDKDGKGPDDDKDEDDKKAWVPPWKKDGVENGKACGDSHIPDGHQCHAGEGDVSAGANGEAKMLDSMEKATAAREKARSLTQEARSVFNTNPDVHLRASSAHMAASGHENEAAKHARSNGDTYIAEMQSNKASYHKAMGDAHKKANAEWGGGSKLATARFIDDAQGAAIAYQKGMEMNASRENDRRRVSNAGTSEGAKKAWETRRGAASSASDAANAMSKSEPVGDVARWHIRAAQLHDKSSSAHVDANPKYSKTGLYGSGFADAAKHHTERSREHGYMADDHRRMSANTMYKHNPKTGRDEVVGNAGNSEGAHEGWLTRRGGVRAGDTFDHESGSGKHVKLTIQGQLDGQKNIELDLPKDVHTAIAAGSWKPNADFEKNSRGEDFHTIHGYEPVTKPGGIREKYGKGSEPDKANGLIGQNVSRAKAYYARARDFGDGTEAQNSLKAKAESILKEIHSKYHPALVKAKAAHASSLGNRAYGVLLNSFRGGLLKNYQQDFQEMLDEVADYASNGETLPDDLREQYEEWMDEQN